MDRRDDIRSRMKEGFGDHAELMGTLKAIDEILDETPDDGVPVVTGDPLVDKWEQEIAAGKLPDWMKSKDSADA